ncbi:hypothetical protein ABZ611_16380 [Streptomyces sp. NPDC007861]|uniref:hypothetical protein n=1 Tax=Streptomyces sp. NPDC007861 TaxID=3154893 RepID=UPI0033CECDF5
MTWAVSASLRQIVDEPPLSRMWMRVYEVSDGQCREIKPRVDVGDTLDPGITENPTQFPDCKCRIHQEGSR